MINNYEIIRPLLDFPNKYSFYFLEILKRRKENPEMQRHAKLIKDYFIYSLGTFDKIQEEVVELCNEHNARAYFRLNVRDSQKIALQYNKRLSELLITEDYKAIPKSYASVVGEFHSDPDKKWLIDLDGDEVGKAENIINFITLLRFDAKQSADAFIQAVPTRNGRHLIVRPFRMDTFKDTYPEIDVHKDNPTILYMP